MKKILLASLICTASMGFVACNGDYDANPNSNNGNVNNPLNPDGGGNGGGGGSLTSGSWKMTAATLTTPAGTTDIYAQMQECDKDNIFTFNTDNTITTDEGATKCSPDDPQTETGGNWSINGSTFTATMDGNTQAWTIVTLDNSTFKITYTGTINGQNTTSTATYSRP